MKKVYTLAEIASQVNGQLISDKANQLPVQALASLSCATNVDLAYFDDKETLELLKTTKAAAVLLTENYIDHCPVAAIVVANPKLSMQLAAKLIVQKNSHEPSLGIHPTAVVHPSARIGEKISLGANTQIGENVLIGDAVCIGANCIIEKNVTIGKHCQIDNNVVLYPKTIIGSFVKLQSGVIIGALPFNSVKKQGYWCSEIIAGNVFIGNSVQIGANTVIVRGTLKDTFIGEGAQIDNLVQIAHDVRIGAYTAIAGCAAIGAFTQIGNHCIIGGASTIAANVLLTDDVVITEMSTVNKSLLKQGIYSSGTTVSEHRLWRKNAARFRRLDDFVTRLCRIEKIGKESS